MEEVFECIELLWFIIQVVNYVVEKMVLDKPLDSMDPDGTFAPGLAGGQLQHPVVGADGSFRSGLKSWQKLKPSIEILCSNQASHCKFNGF